MAVKSIVHTVLKLKAFFFFFVRNRVWKVEYEIAVVEAPDVSSSIDLAETWCNYGATGFVCAL